MTVHKRIEWLSCGALPHRFLEMRKNVYDLPYQITLNYGWITHNIWCWYIWKPHAYLKIWIPMHTFRFIQKIIFLFRWYSAQEKLDTWIRPLNLMIQCFLGRLETSIASDMRSNSNRNVLVKILMKAHQPGNARSWRPTRNMFDSCRTNHKFDCSFCSWSACTEVPCCTSTHRAHHLESHRSTCKVMFDRETLFGLPPRRHKTWIVRKIYPMLPRVSWYSLRLST